MERNAVRRVRKGAIILVGAGTMALAFGVGSVLTGAAPTSSSDAPPTTALSGQKAIICKYVAGKNGVCWVLQTVINPVILYNKDGWSSC